jgi:hypothetical protein
MSCTNHASRSFVVAPAPRRAGARWPAFVKMIVVIIDAFQEALAMRRDAHRKYPFDNE